MVRDISNMAEIHYIRQKDVLGLGNAVYCARKFIGNEPFAILLGDDIVDSAEPCLKQLMDVYDTYQQPVIGVQPVDWKDTSQYGIISYEKTGSPVMKVLDLIEKPQMEPPSNMAIMGRYILTPDIFDYLAYTEPGLGGEIQLTDALRTLAGSRDMLAYNFTGKRYDIGSKLGFLKATINFSLQRQDIQAELMNYLDSIMQPAVR
ncbi:UTP--glucose-1-phosphate uridylyltransferase [compost metagenome]